MYHIAHMLHGKPPFRTIHDALRSQRRTRDLLGRVLVQHDGGSTVSPLFTTDASDIFKGAVLISQLCIDTGIAAYQTCCYS